MLLTGLGLVGIGAALSYATAARLNAAVAVVSQGPVMEAYLAKPGVSFVETWFRFEDDLKDDVLFGVDQEFIEGVDKPCFVKGGDWMAAICLQRPGNVWVSVGTENSMRGQPEGSRNWKILNLGCALKPNIWYHMKCYVDFGTRHFKSLTVDGPGLNKTFDISAYTVDYPNYMPFDKRCMSYYALGIRSRSMMKERGKPLVFFDDLRGGVVEPVTGAASGAQRETIVFSTDFENQKTMLEQPLTLPVIKLGNYREGALYYERKESRFAFADYAKAHSGRRVGVADCDLD